MLQPNQENDYQKGQDHSDKKTPQVNWRGRFWDNAAKAQEKQERGYQCEKDQHGTNIATEFKMKK